MRSNGTDRSKLVLRSSYLAATVSELQRVKTLTRIIALANQRVLFPHRGELEMSTDALSFENWRTITATDLRSVTQEFIPEYGRFLAGGVRGGFPSLGIAKRTGAPLILNLSDGEQIVLMIGYKVFSGISQNSSWLPALQEFII